MIEWSWPCKQVAKGKGRRVRFLVGICPLQPLPGGKSVEFRLHLQQWDEKAADPFGWCINIMKYAGAPGESMDPYQALQHIQVSEQDWTVFFSTWEGGGAYILATLRELKAKAPPVQTSLVGR